MSAAGWERVQGLMRQVAVAKGGAAVFGLGLNNQPYVWNGSNWSPIPNSPVLTQIAIGQASQVYGLGTQGDIYRWRSDKQNWTRIKGNLKTISVGTDGTLGGVNSAHTSWLRKESDVQAELRQPTVDPQWLKLETPSANIEIVDVDTAVLVDTKGLPVQRARGAL